MEFFYRQDKDRDGRVTRHEFIEGIIRSSQLAYNIRRNFS